MDIYFIIWSIIFIHMYYGFYSIIRKIRLKLMINELQNKRIFFAIACSLPASFIHSLILLVLFPEWESISLLTLTPISFGIVIIICLLAMLLPIDDPSEPLKSKISIEESLKDDIWRKHGDDDEVPYLIKVRDINNKIIGTYPRLSIWKFYDKEKTDNRKEIIFDSSDFEVINRFLQTSEGKMQYFRDGGGVILDNCAYEVIDIAVDYFHYFDDYSLYDYLHGSQLKGNKTPYNTQIFISVVKSPRIDDTL